MFGKIIAIDSNIIIIENNSKKVESSLLGVHLIFEGKHKIVAEITHIDTEKIECILVGEFIDDRFVSGMTHKPSSDSNIRVVTTDEVLKFIGKQTTDSKDEIYIGKSLVYDGFSVSANLDNFFSNHFAILGNTGSGKSCTVARLFQNLFYRQNYYPVNSHIVLFDVYGEYHSAFEKINQTKCKYKILTTDTSADPISVIKFPAYFLEVDDIALLLNVTSPTQLPIIEKALKYVYLFTEEESKVITYKNNIIAKAILDILTSGKEPAQIRDHVVAILTTFHTKDISLDSQIVQPGYIRTLRQCLNIDQTGKINTIQLVTEFIEGFVNDDLKLNENMKPKNYKLKDLYDAFEFALISEGVLKSDKVYDANNILKVRLESIINGEYAKYFDYNEYVTKEEYVRRLFKDENSNTIQLLNFNLNYVDERFAKTFTKIYSKLLLDYAIGLDKQKNFSVQIILEEAHRYVQNDMDVNTLGYNIFDRITKEGRKYGVVLGLITQRPSELSNTALSQCSNYIILRMFHPDDLAIVKSLAHSISESDVEKLKSLGPGIGLCFGNAFSLPVFARIDPPNPYPNSANAHIKDSLFNQE